jgi:hypothetical protein
MNFLRLGGKRKEGWRGMRFFFLVLTECMAILLEIFKESLSDPRSGPFGTTSIRSHPDEQARRGRVVKEGKVAERRMEGSGSEARKVRRMSQSRSQLVFPLQHSKPSRNPHSKKNMHACLGLIPVV